MSSTMLNANVDLMNKGLGFDVVVVCTSTENQANYWQMRLEDGCGTFLPAKTHVVAVHEDWEGGAGNALGTLYAYQKAMKKGADLYGIDFDAGLQAGSISIGLYHSAGKGTRLAPMPGAENNNKPGVKLCASVRLKKAGMVPITILESVIKQTGCYAQSRRGRLSVFWGDQIFVPSVSVLYTPTHHADILCKLGPMVDEAEWAAKGLQSYGLIVKGIDGEAAQVEKVDHTTAMKMLKAFGEIDSVGASLGSFSVSAAFVSCLMTEFAKELQAKKGKMDSDPHLWMPMTLERDVYVDVMHKKGMTNLEAGLHFDRVRKMIAEFRSNPDNTTLGNFGAVNIGPDCSWWDYGMLKLYQKNNLLMIENSEDGALMRKFFRVGSTGILGGLLDSLFGFTGGLGSRVSSSSMGSTFVDACSIVQSSTIGSGGIKNCIVNNVRCNKIDAEGAILVNVTADSIVARNGSIVYNTVEPTLDMGAGDVRVGVADASGTLTIMKSAMDVDGGKAWDEKVKGNAYSFGEVYKINGSADPIALEDVIKRIHSDAWSTLKDTSMSFSSSFLDSYWAPVSGIAAVAAVASVAAVLARRK